MKLGWCHRAYAKAEILLLDLRQSGEFSGDLFAQKQLGPKVDITATFVAHWLAIQVGNRSSHPEPCDTRNWLTDGLS